MLPQPVWGCDNSKVATINGRYLTSEERAFIDVVEEDIKSFLDNPTHDKRWVQFQRLSKGPPEDRLTFEFLRGESTLKIQRSKSAIILLEVIENGDSSLRKYPQYFP